MQTVSNKIPAAPGLTAPESLWCPRCQVHTRHQDGYGSDAHTLMDLCPVCAP